VEHPLFLISDHASYRPVCQDGLDIRNAGRQGNNYIHSSAMSTVAEGPKLAKTVVNKAFSGLQAMAGLLAIYVPVFPCLQ
jgi:hypothetical protein